jgi:hypothetical protein
MRGFIRRKYGERAERFVGHWIRGEPRDDRITARRSDPRPPNGTCGSRDG